MTVPFIIALGVGIAAIRNDKHASDDSFDLVSLCSIGPILSVLVLGLIYHPEGASYVPKQIPDINKFRGIMGTGGGTVIHAKGIGMEKAEQFLGVSIAAEKEMIFIVTKSKGKNEIMKAIMEQAGMNSKAKSIVFFLPVTSTAGLRLQEEEPAEEI